MIRIGFNPIAFKGLTRSDFQRVGHQKVELRNSQSDYKGTQGFKSLKIGRIDSDNFDWANVLSWPRFLVSCQQQNHKKEDQSSSSLHKFASRKSVRKGTIRPLVALEA